MAKRRGPLFGIDRDVNFRMKEIAVGEVAETPRRRDGWLLSGAGEKALSEHGVPSGTPWHTSQQGAQQDKTLLLFAEGPYFHWQINAKTLNSRPGKHNRSKGLIALNVLITGGAGYIGSILLRQFLERGYDVTVLDTFARGGTELADCCRFETFHPVRGDARDERTVKSLLAKSDVVIPLAAIVGAPACARDAIGATSINRDAILMILRLLGRQQRLVFPTTNSGYGVGEQGKLCTEETPLRPISLYGSTKVEAERAVLDGGNGITLRLATVFGMSPQMRIDLLVNDFTYRAVTDAAVIIFEGHFKRNFIHIRDVAKAFLHALDNYKSMNNQPYNVGLSDANLSKLELCERIKRQVPKFVFLEALIGEDPDKRDYIVSNAKIEATGFRPDWSLDAGIAELIKGYTMLNNRRYSNV